MPVVGDLDATADVVRNLGAGTVAVLSCPEMDGIKLRTLAWELEKTGTDLYVAPALLDVAGPRTTIRPTAGLTLLHVDHPQLSGPRQVLKDLFDRSVAALVLLAFSPLMLAIALAIRLSDKGPALFTQIRVGKDGQSVQDLQVPHDGGGRGGAPGGTPGEERVRRGALQDPQGSAHHRASAHGCGSGRLTSCRSCSTCCSARCRWWDRGRRCRTRQRRYADHVRRRLVVKPGLTGMWQVNGRSNLSWDETVRLDLRYVENWSFALDLQILWKTLSVIFRGSGAY